MELRKYYEKSEEISADDELVKRTKEYMAENKETDYSKASSAVLQADPELARAYAMEDLSDYQPPEPEKNFIPAKPKKMTDHQISMQASATIAQKAELIMLERNLDYITAQQIVFKRHPELLKAYTAGIIEGE